MQGNNNYFNNNYFSKIIKLVEEYRLDEAMYQFDNYIKLYPNDLRGYTYYAETCIKNGYFDKASEILDMAKISKKTSKLSKDELLRVKIELLSCQEKYSECYELLMNNIKVFYDHMWLYEGFLTFLRNKLNKNNEKSYKPTREKYLLEQLTSYDSERAISHIERHMPDSNYDTTAIFNYNFPLNDVYYKLRNLLPLDGRIYSNFFDNIYIFKYDCCGHVDSKLVDYLYVVTVRNTNDIITMYPYNNKSGTYVADITPSYDKPKIKHISQVDKFYKRYGK